MAFMLGDNPRAPSQNMPMPGTMQASASASPAMNPFFIPQQQYQLGSNQANDQFNYANQQNQLSLSAIPRQLSYQDLLGNLANQQFGLQRTQANQNATQQNQALTSQATASDALQSQGTRTGFSNISDQLANSLQGININQQQQRAQTAEQKAQLNDQAKQYGITGEQLKSALDNTLAALGLSETTSGAQIASQLQSLSPQDQDYVRQFMQYAVTYGQFSPKNGINPQLLTPDTTTSGL